MYFQDRVFINFGNSTFQWVDLKLFRLPTALDDGTALSRLIGHDRYQDDYSGSSDDAVPGVHARYRLDQISVDSFVLTEASPEEDVLRAWAEQYAPLPDPIRDDLERELYPRLRHATRCYRLADLGEEAWHPYGGIVGGGGFHELVLIDHARQEVALVVAADD